MTRLTHSDAGFLRALQISNTRLFAFTEGGLDRPFVDRLLRFAFPAKVWAHQVVAMKEFPSTTGGKPALLSLFKTLRRKGQLSFTAFGKPMVCVFYADKDIDDIQRTKVRSPHFFYSAAYDLEGHLFQCGDLVAAVADACLLTTRQATSLLGNPSTWVEHYARAWKEWICLCIISKKSSVNVGCGFGQPSSINSNYIGPVDPQKLNALQSSIQTAQGVTSAQFARQFRAVRQTVEASLATEPLKYFKGKWLRIVMQKHLESKGRIPDSNLVGASDRILSALVAQVGISQHCGCCSPSVGSLRPLCAHL